MYQYYANNNTFRFGEIKYNMYFCNNINVITLHFMKNRPISVCINTNTKEMIAFQSISSLAKYVGVNRITIVRKSIKGNIIRDIPGFMIFLNVEYRRISK